MPRRPGPSARPRWPAALLVAACLLGACAAGGSAGPDLARLYQRAARSHGPDRNPVVLVPGILGSRLRDAADGTVVWGAFSGQYADPQTPDGARRLALPMRPGAPLAQLTDTVQPDGVLDQVRIHFLGIPLAVQAYYHILGTLGVGGYRDESLGLAGTVDYGDDHYTCFQFPYDWRRDIAESAARFGAFLDEKRTYVREQHERRFGASEAPIRFDVVAHSMGALVVRYYLRYGGAPLPEDGSLPALTWAGAADLERVVLVAPPNAGSLSTLQDLSAGLLPGPWLPFYSPVLLGTMPSTYQLLPRARHHALQAWDGTRPRLLDPFDPAVWEQFGWGLADPQADETLAWLLPELPDAAARRAAALEHLRRCLQRARQFTAALDAPGQPPEGVRLMLVAGDALPTAAVASADPAAPALTILEERAGDGTVLRSSALMDERVAGPWSPRLVSPVAWSQVLFLFQDHLDLTRSPEFTDNVLFLLLEGL